MDVLCISDDAFTEVLADGFVFCFDADEIESSACVILDFSKRSRSLYLYLSVVIKRFNIPL